MAPEMIKGSYNEKCDIWSCGVILYLILSGAYPFSGQNDRQLEKQILSGKYSLKGDAWDNVSSEAKSLIKSMLEVKPERRCSAAAALKHPWLTSSGNPEVKLNTNVLGNIKKLNVIGA